MDWTLIGYWLGVFLAGMLVGAWWAILADSRRQWERVLRRRQGHD
jgi:protein-S-isoprenylcysteine O-methyltransferase Ste14